MFKYFKRDFWNPHANAVLKIIFEIILRNIFPNIPDPTYVIQGTFLLFLYINDNLIIDTFSRDIYSTMYNVQRTTHMYLRRYCTSITYPHWIYRWGSPPSAPRWKNDT